MKQIIEGLIGFIMAAIVIGVAFYYLTMPQAGIDHVTGQCVWIQYYDEPERKSCPLDLPSKYEKIYVWVDDSKGSQHHYAP